MISKVVTLFCICYVFTSVTAKLIKTGETFELLRVKRGERKLIARAKLVPCKEDDDVVFVEEFKIDPYPVIIGENVSLTIYSAITETISPPINIYINAEARIKGLFDSNNVMKLNCKTLHPMVHLMCPVEMCSLMKKKQVVATNFITNDAGIFSCPLEKGLFFYSNIIIDSKIPPSIARLMTNDLEATAFIYVKNKNDKRLGCATVDITVESA
ncbi:uncharacterized protein LOC111614329 [Centruroides sculpturatus]|uniref:uncharacterized protein LOC111614329 n=1 Tax=Centruroides sculpturatus TaxID=218467 RepID=UPI000C6E55E8|nr:uncharacterized protein LOC111614329 [Centruroides sculpturatus]